MSKAAQAIALIIPLLHALLADAYPSTAQVCDVRSTAIFTDRASDHNNPRALPGTNPPRITLNATYYYPYVPVRVLPAASARFKGILLYANDAQGSRAGNFRTPLPTGLQCFTPQCDPACATVQHRNSNNKDPAALTWFGPPTNVGNVTFSMIYLMDADQWYIARDVVLMPHPSLPPPPSYGPSFKTADGKFKVDWVLAAPSVDFTITCQCTGWVSIGIGASSLMNDADYWVFWVNGGGTVTALDTRSTSYNQPTNDRLDLTSVTGTQAGGVTTIKFKRLLNTNDGTNDVPITTGLMWMHWGYHATAIGNGNSYPAHTSRGALKIDFYATGNDTYGGTAGSDDPLSGGNTTTNSGGGNTFSSGGFTCSWVISPDGKMIDITMEAPTAGWISMGVGQTEYMASADYWTGWVTGTGQAVMVDSWSTGYSQPAEDTATGGKADLQNIAGTSTAGVTQLKFRRLLDTLDAATDIPITDAGNILQWAFGTNPGDANKAFTAHSRVARGAARVNFLTGAVTLLEPEEMDPGRILLITVATLLVAYTIGRYSYKYRKYQQLKQKESQLLSNSASNKVGRVEIKSNGMHDNSTANGTGNGHATASHHSGPQAKSAATQEATWLKQWVRYQAEDGTPYFYNVKTQETAWEIPPMPDMFGGQDALRWGTGEQAQAISANGADLGKAKPLHTKAAVRAFDSVQDSDSEPGALSPSSAQTRAASPTIIGGINRKEAGAKQSKLAGILHLRLPGGQVSVLQLLLLGFFILLLWFSMAVGLPGSKNHLATAFGSLTAGLVFMQVIPSTRNGILGWCLDVPFDRVIVYHRWLGRVVFLTLSLHMILFWDQWATTTNGSILETQFQNQDPMYLWGFFGWLVCAFINILSMDWFRRRHFNLFFYSHVVFFVTFFVCGCYHHEKFRAYAIAAAFFYGLDRVIRVFWGMIPVKADKVEVFKDITCIRFPKHWLARFGVNLYHPGQYVFLNFPQVSPLEWHPFSISSGPDEHTVQVYIRGLGDHTKQLLAHVSAKEKDGSKKPLWMRCDGPYGTLRLNYRRFPVTLLVSGGIGITPALGILKDVYRLGDIGKSRGSDRQEALSTMAAHCMEAVFIVWVIPDERMYEWFAPEFQAAWDALGAENLPNLNLWVYCTRSKQEDLKHSDVCVAGRPDFDQIFDTITNEYPGRAVQVFSCGPSVMVNDAWDCSMRRNRQGQYFSFHHETFEF